MATSAKKLIVQAVVDAPIVAIAQRKNSTKRGYGYRWQKYRVSFLKKNPLCRDCNVRGLVVAATDVDHIVPAKPDERLFWDTKNHQGLCHSCHSKKTALEDGGFGNKKRIK